MKFLVQPYKSQKCGQTCLAMITDDTVEGIVDEIGKKWTLKLDDDIVPFLIKKGYSPKYFWSPNLTWREIPNNSIVRLAYEDGGAHFVVKYEDKYYDPAVGIIERYEACFRTPTHYVEYGESQYKDDLPF